MRLIVVGAGVVGAACAYTASGLGAEVVLVDAGLSGQATAAGAGIICPWTSHAGDAAWYGIARAAAREYPGLAAELAELGDISYRQVGALIITRDEHEADLYCQQLKARRAAAPEIGEVRIVPAAEARSLFPPLRPGAVAVYVGGAARVDGRRLRDVLVRAARDRGAAVVTGQATLACRGPRGDRIAGAEVDGQLVPADAVVAAAGAWTNAFVRPAGVDVRVAPERGQIVHLRLDAADTGNWPVILPAGSGHYLLAFDDSRVVVGATREPGSGFDARVTAGGLDEVLTEALAVAPGLASATHLETRVGLRPAGPDPRPLLGRVPGLTGLVVATGLGASGLTLGPLTGAVAARTALGVDQPFDVAPFDPLR
jgi:glycine/D-amino acid oxidase-like deaminating enzyme